MAAAAQPVEPATLYAGRPLARCTDPECAAGGDHGEPWRCLGHKKRRDKRGRKVPCKGTRVAGAKVCRMHGADAPQVRRSARQRLDAMVEPAMALMEKALEKILNTPGMELSAVAVSYMREVMDRAGYPRVSKVELEEVKARELHVYTDAVVGIIRRACALAGLDLKDDKVRSAVGQATKEWAERNRKAET